MGRWGETNDDDEDFVEYGTPIALEQEAHGYRKV